MKKNNQAANNPPNAPVTITTDTKELDTIIVTGAREHNLKNIDVRLPKKKLVVITGVSGSGKSSLAFDTIFAEGQRRYVESLSAYARQFIGQMEKPKYETIRGLSPTIAIEQKSASRNPRSTVGTITEIYDYLRVLYARIGQQYCYKCGAKVGTGHAQGMVDRLMVMAEGTRIILLAPLVEHRKGEHRETLTRIQQKGFARVRIDGVIQEIEGVQQLAKNKKHTIEVVVDRLVIEHSPAFQQRLNDSVETALLLGKGNLTVHIKGQTEFKMSEARSCCKIAYPELEPALFSFNAPKGMCSACNGIGTQLSMDPDKIIPDQRLSIRQGAVLPWRGYFSKTGSFSSSWGASQLKAMAENWKIDVDVPWCDLPARQRKLILQGSGGKEIKVAWNSEKIQGEFTTAWDGLLNILLRRYQQTQSEAQKKYYADFMSSKKCSVCKGLRLKPEVVSVRVQSQNITALCAMTIAEAFEFISQMNLTGNDKLIGEEVVKEIANRLQFLINVGLDYLTLDRSGPSLSGGESQRIRLASQVGSELTGVLYVLDEPSIGLHQRDHLKLLATLRHLRDIGNSLIVIEHDRETMVAADWIVDMGPGAGLLGGDVVAEGPPPQLGANTASLTGRYLSGNANIDIPCRRTTPKMVGNHWITIKKAKANNLKNLNVRIPLGLLVAITGVSGAGKSTLVNQILYPALARRLHGAAGEIGPHAAIEGMAHIDKVINIDQKAIGRTPRSNPATYTKVFDLIRGIFSLLPESRVRGYAKGRFSFNVKGGRCEACKGDGYNKVEMHFLADVYVPCETCRGKRFNQATLEVTYKSHSIADVLDLSVNQALPLFDAQPGIKKIIKTLAEVGLGYIKLGQSATTLSGGEAQRIKLARELAKTASGCTLFILDEPTTGLHFEDIKMLLKVLKKLTAAGNSVIIFEHNLDVIKTADWIVDLGPEGGKKGGRLVAQGTPEKVAQSKRSYTGKYLNPILAAETNTEKQA